MIIDEEEHLSHYGTPRRSGRYPWGSGDGTLPQDNASLLDYVKDLRRQGMKDTDIAKGLGIKSTQFRALYSIAKEEQKHAQRVMAIALQNKGLSNGAIAQRMGLAGESSVRALTAAANKDKKDALTTTAEALKQHVDEHGLLDIGAGTEYYVGSGISQDRLRAAVEILKAKGYKVETIPIPQLGTGKDTQQKVLAPPGTTWGDIKRNQDKITTFQSFTDDGGGSFTKRQPPLAINPRRVEVNYKEDGGDKADGVLYVRPGVKDLDLGNSPYAQVRVQVGDKHFLKGMALVKNDLPDGVDILFNTSKSNTGNKFDAMKPLEPDPDLPFGSIVRQITDPKTGKVTSAMNIVGVRETSGIEGSWDEWSKTLSSQMLSKQQPNLAKDQLGKTYDQRKKEFDEINALTNPTVKKKLLEEFAASTDSAAVHLKAAAMPRQATKVILPMNSLKENEVYAPGFRDGESVVLIRYPHGGQFEIPELTVNTKHAPGKKLIGDSRDAIGIHHKVAQKLSGADFDGDTVIIIPNSQGKIKHESPLEGLKNFDPKMYKVPDGSPIPRMTAHQKGIEMGKVSNLITDMTIRGAPHSDIVRAVRHSMVVIDAEKHHLDYRLSAQRENIKQLAAQYQTPHRENRRAGASTLISRARHKEQIPELKPRPMSEGGPIDTSTGRRIRVPSGKTRFDRKTGQRVPKTGKYNLLDLHDNAHDLSSGTRIEEVYAEHSNRLKNLANEARLASLHTPRLKYSDSSARVFAKEASSLNAKLALAKMNAPRERQAQLVASAKVKAKRAANPNLDKDTLKKVESSALAEARIRMGAHKTKIEITPEEWTAIQSGAISNHKLTEVLNHANMDVVRSHATPRTKLLMTSTKTRRARSLLNSGLTRAEVADKLGVSLTTLDTSLKE